MTSLAQITDDETKQTATIGTIRETEDNLQGSLAELLRQNHDYINLIPVTLMKTFTLTCARLEYVNDEKKEVEDTVAEISKSLDEKLDANGIGYDEYNKHATAFKDILEDAQKALILAEDKATCRYTRQELFPVWDARGELDAADRFLGMLRRSAQVGDAPNENLLRKELALKPKLRVFTDHVYMLQHLFPFLLTEDMTTAQASLRNLAAIHAMDTTRPLTWSCAAGLGNAEDYPQDPGMYVLHAADARHPARRRIDVARNARMVRKA